MRKGKPALLILAAALALAGAWVVWRLSRPSPPAGPGVSITFLGMTNDLVGTSAARFVVSNLHLTSIELSPTVNTRVTNGWVVSGLAGGGTLRAGAAQMFTVQPAQFGPLPTTNLPYRLSIRYYSDGKVARLFYTLVGMVRSALNLEVRHSTMPHEIHSEWIEHGVLQPGTAGENEQE